MYGGIEKNYKNVMEERKQKISKEKIEYVLEDTVRKMAEAVKTKNLKKFFYTEKKYLWTQIIGYHCFQLDELYVHNVLDKYERIYHKIQNKISDFQRSLI